MKKSFFLTVLTDKQEVLGHCAISFSISINRRESSEWGLLLSSVPNPSGPSVGLSRHSFRQSHRGLTSATIHSSILLSYTNSTIIIKYCDTY